jgi:hypothetical protein
MRSAFTYRDALKILGKDDHHTLDIIDRLLGGAILGSGAVGASAVFALVDQKNEATGLARKLVTAAKARWRKTTGHSRHELLEAAHTTIVVAAMFEEFAALVGKDVHEQLKFHDLEKVWVMEGAMEQAVNNIRVNVTLLLELHAPLPTPALGFEKVADEYLEPFYQVAKARLATFLQCLQNAEVITLETWRSLAELPANAVARYREYYENLAADVPEFFVWASLRSQSFVERTVAEATRQATANAGALERVEQLLRAVVDGDRAGKQERVLSDINVAYLRQPLARGGLDADGLALPTVEAGYVTPAYRAAVAQYQSNIADPAFWQAVPVRDDIEEFFVGYLSSPDAAVKPLVVLGHPGAGKSMMTRVLAARLPTSLFVTAWVPLRRVDPDAPVHRQIEQAVEDATNGRVSWCGLSDACRDVTRVVILDGFDELMQTTGVVQSRYLEDLAEFQRREQQLGQPISVVVTSRTVVADRARIPSGCVVLRLEDFDEPRIRDWLGRWERTNAVWFDTDRYRALTFESAMACAPLSSQPLLLMMIALYVANPKVPEPDGEEVTTGALYRSLIDEFVKRELAKETRSDQVAEEMMAERQLSLGFTGFAMFNRGRLHVDERTLERDFEFLYDEKAGPDTTSLDEPLSRSQQTIGAFFFVHKSEVGRSDRRRLLRTYEFLHATVGEFLIARTVYELMADAAAVWRGRPTIGGVRATTSAPGGEQGALLTELLSCQTMAKLPNIVAFVADLAGPRADGEKKAVVAYARVLMDHIYFHGVPVRYEFVPLSQIGRQANLLANLASVVVAIDGSVVVGSSAATVEHWRSMVRLLRAGLDAESWLAFATAYMVLPADDGLRLMNQVDRILEGPLYRLSPAQTADLAEQILLGQSQKELRLSTSGLHQMFTLPQLPYMTGFFDGLAALAIYRNAETDPRIYRRMGELAVSFPPDAGALLVDAIPLVLEVVERDAFGATDELLENIAFLLDTLRLCLSAFAEPEIDKWAETPYAWLQNIHRTLRG